MRLSYNGSTLPCQGRDTGSIPVSRSRKGSLAVMVLIGIFSYVYASTVSSKSLVEQSKQSYDSLTGLTQPVRQKILSQQSTTTPVISGQPDSWKTYINNQYGFEIQYPFYNSFYGLDIEVNDYKSVSDGPGAFYLQADKIIWQSRLNDKSKYKVGDNCLTGDTGETTIKNISCSVVSLNPYVYKIVQPYSDNGQLNGQLTILDFPNSNFDFSIHLPWTLSDQVINQTISSFKLSF